MIAEARRASAITLPCEISNLLDVDVRSSKPTQTGFAVQNYRGKWLIQLARDRRSENAEIFGPADLSLPPRSDSLTASPSGSRDVGPIRSSGYRDGLHKYFRADRKELRNGAA